MNVAIVVVIFLWDKFRDKESRCIFCRLLKLFCCVKTTYQNNLYRTTCWKRIFRFLFYFYVNLNCYFFMWKIYLQKKQNNFHHKNRIKVSIILKSTYQKSRCVRCDDKVFITFFSLNIDSKKHWQYIIDNGFQYLSHVLLYTL